MLVTFIMTCMTSTKINTTKKWIDWVQKIKKLHNKTLRLSDNYQYSSEEEQEEEKEKQDKKSN